MPAPSDAASALGSFQDLPRLNVTLLGPSGSGKSTLAGHLLLKSGAVSRSKVEQYERGAAAMNRAHAKHAWIVDQLPEERGRGCTVDFGVAGFATSKYGVVLTDVPGGQRYVANLMTGTFYSDCVVLVLDASPGAFESSLVSGRGAGSTKELVQLAYTLGVRNMVVAVNKMDAVPSGAEATRLDGIQREMGPILKKAGFNVDKVPFVVVSAQRGDNLTAASPRPASWPAGVALTAALDAVETPKRAADKALRMTVQDVYHVRGTGVVPAGRIEAGAVRPGMTLRVLPGGFEVQVKAVQEFKRDVQEALAGANVALSFKGEVSGPLSRGSVLCEVEGSSREAASFQAQLLVQHSQGILPGYCPTLDVHAAHVPCRITQLISKLDRKTGKEVEKAPLSLEFGDIALVEMVPLQPLMVEPFTECAALGRFAIRDMQQVVGMGIIKAVTPRQWATKAAQAVASK